MNSDSHNNERRRNADINNDLLMTISNNLTNLIRVYDDNFQENKERHKDHETRIRFLEKALFVSIGALAILQIVLTFMKQ